jgi:4-amino-4-deoxy-L-arabinose transferase-like glycosyltransferase
MPDTFRKCLWDTAVRILFWVAGSLIAAILTYTTRYFINGDAIAYVEMGEALRHGQLWGLANLTYSPGYPVLLGLGQILFNTSPSNELEVLRLVNFFCFILAMGSCELFMKFCKREATALWGQNEAVLPPPIMSLLCYSTFLLAAIVWIKVQLLNPDMLVMAVMLTCAAVILWIRENPRIHKYVVLGVCCGIGYFVKSFFFVFSGVFFLLAALCSDSYWKALSRTAVAIFIMLLVGSPLMAALSHKLGRFTYGELGKHAYAYFISGTGEPFRPKLIDAETRTCLYRGDDPGTKPSDMCYWHEGIVPKFDLKAHSRVFLGNLIDVFIQLPFIFLIVVWYLSQVRCCSYSFRSSHPPSFYLILSFICVGGIGFYSLIHVETRYIASALFIGFAALVMSVRYPDRGNWKALIPSILFLSVLWLHLIYSGLDQTRRSLQSTPEKPSYKESYSELQTVKNFVLHNGLKRGDETAILGEPPLYWARYAGVRITAEIEAPQKFLSLDEKGRSRVLAKLNSQGTKAVVGKGEQLRSLAQEGWRHVAGTRDYYVIFLSHGY